MGVEDGQIPVLLKLPAALRMPAAAKEAVTPFTPALLGLLEDALLGVKLPPGFEMDHFLPAGEAWLGEEVERAATFRFRALTDFCSLVISKGSGGPGPPPEDPPLLEAVGALLLLLLLLVVVVVVVVVVLTLLDAAAATTCPAAAAAAAVAPAPACPTA